jgi:hypothetical protein
MNDWEIPDTGPDARGPFENKSRSEIVQGGHIANFSNMKSKFKWLSIREIVPPGSHGPDTTNTKSKVAYASRFLYQGP